MLKTDVLLDIYMYSHNTPIFVNDCGWKNIKLSIYLVTSKNAISSTLSMITPSELWS